jgi:CRISPR-associated protein Cmr2
MSYLFLVTIGPVQDFIASARRTRDLAFGSWLLSELSKIAAYKITELNGLESLIFPAPSQEELLRPDSGFIAANKIIALVQQAPEVLGPLVHDAVRTRLRDIRNIAYTGVPLGEKQTIAEAQVDDLIEVLWAGLPFEGSPYRDARKLLGVIMDARKNTRDFAQVTWGSSEKKSSIDGQLESVIPDSAYYHPGASESERRTKLRDLYELYGARPAERLSGVDLLKRRGTTAFGTHFPSTSHMATVPFLQRLKVLTGPQFTQAQKAWKSYIDVVQKHAFSPKLEQIPNWYPTHDLLSGYDGSMLFEERLVDVLYAPGVDLTRDKKFQEARNALQAFYKVLDHEFADLGFARSRPDPYYALLRADGDSMGAAIDAQAGSGYQQHRAISQRLSSFAERVKQIVSEHQGALVYTGGDDVLAFLPLHTVLACASKLAEEFEKALREFAHLQDPAPSLSVGIAVAHHLDSLRKVRQIVDQAERRAKQVPGKRALAITISKRSGESYNVAGHWGELDASLRRLSVFCYNQIIPAGTAYELRDLAVRLGISIDETYISSREEEISDRYAEVIRWDALRIMQRKLYVPLGKAEQRQAEAVEDFFKTRLGTGQASYPGGEHIGPLIREVINELIIAQILADAQRQATPTKEARRP